MRIQLDPKRIRATAKEAFKAEAEEHKKNVRGCLAGHQQRLAEMKKLPLHMRPTGNIEQLLRWTKEAEEKPRKISRRRRRW